MPQQWQFVSQWGHSPVLDFRVDAERCRRLVVVSAHPDDESLGVGGLIAQAHRAGVAVYVVLLTAGEASHPPTEHGPRQALALRRLAELGAALDLLAPGSPVAFLGAPDGGVAEVEDEVVTALSEIVGDGAGTMLVAPWRHDGHPDHDAAGRAAARVAEACAATLVEYPLVSWRHPDDVPRLDLAVVHLDEATTALKRAAIRAHSSQLGAVDTRIEGSYLSRFTTSVEYVILSPAAAGADSFAVAAQA